MDMVTLQILLALAMLATTAVAGLLPIKVLNFIHKKHGEANRKSSWCLTLLSCFAGGVFMGTCFLDIFPHVNSNYTKFREKAGWQAAYPLPEFFVCCGFFLVYFLEELSLKVFSSMENGHSYHGHSHGSTSGCGRPDTLQNSCPREPLKVPPLNSLSSNHKQNEATAENGSTVDDKDSTANGSMTSVPEKYLAIMTHDRLVPFISLIVMDESVRYINSPESETGFLQSLTFAIAMSFHSVLEGIALGVQENTSGIMTLFLSLIIHKGIEAFSVGLQISKTNSKRIGMVTLTIIIYALMTPVGSMLGVMITHMDINELVKDGIVVILEGLAGGTFIYVTFFEVLAQERANDHSNLIQLNAIVVGFLAIAGLQINEHFSGMGHSHGH